MQATDLLMDELEMQVLGQTQAGGREEHSHHLHY